MEKQRVTVFIGSSKALIYEADPKNKDDQLFAKLCQEVAESQPQSIQEFFTRLNELQQKPSLETNKKRGRSI